MGKKLCVNVIVFGQPASYILLLFVSVGKILLLLLIVVIVVFLAIVVYYGSINSYLLNLLGKRVFLKEATCKVGNCRRINNQFHQS